MGSVAAHRDALKLQFPLWHPTLNPNDEMIIVDAQRVGSPAV